MTFAAQLQDAKGDLTARQVASAVSPLLSVRTQETYLGWLRAGNDIATVMERMGHDSLETTALYAHADHARGVSPLDAGDRLVRVGEDR